LITLKLNSDTVLSLYRQTGIPVRTISRILDNLIASHQVQCKGKNYEAVISNEQSNTRTTGCYSHGTQSHSG
jgi:hypothetical protein